MTHRFFIPSNWFNPPIVELRDDTARQIKIVLRMQPGDEIVVLDNSGTEYQVKLTEFAKNSITGRIIAQQPSPGEPGVKLTLYQGTLKGQKFEWVLQKGTELGVSSFVPTICQRSILRNPAAIEKKYPRWHQIIKEAAEQSGRGKLPHLAAPLPLDKALTQAQSSETLILFPWEEADDISLKRFFSGDDASNIALFIGPEGGFALEESRLAKNVGAKLIKLGQRILRAETAGIATCAVIMYAVGEWG